MTTKPCFLLATIFLSVFCFAQTNQPVDYLTMPGPIVFNKQSYNLNWSSHPADNFYKQEYLVKGDVTDHFKSMLLIDVITNEKDLKGVVNAKILELKEMKTKNPMVNYQVFDNAKTGEYMIDFLLSANSADGKTVAVVERNVYRYKLTTDKEGQSAVLLFGVSIRSYGNDITPFLSNLKTSKQLLINTVAAFTIPKIIIP